MNNNKILLNIGFNTSIQYVSRIGSVFLSSLSVLLLTRYLGVEKYGEFSLIFAFLTFFVAFSDFGLQMSIVNKLSKKEVSQEDVFGTYLMLKIILITISLGISFIVLVFLPYANSLKFAILFSSIGVGIGALGGFSNTFFQYQLRLSFIGILDVLNRLLTVGLILLFIVFRQSFLFILSSVLISNLITVFVTFIILKKSILFKLSFNLKLAKSLIRGSFFIGIAGFLAITYFKLDTIMLSVFKNSREVGIYTLSYKIFENVIIIWTFYMSSFYPFISKFYHEGSESKLNNLLRKGVYLSLSLSIVVIIIGYVFAPAFVSVFGGQGFSQSVLPFRILILSSIFLFVNAIFYNLLFVKGKTIRIVAALLLSLVFNFIVNLFFIPKYGFIGASITTVLTEIFLTIMYLSLYFKSNVKQ